MERLCVRIHLLNIVLLEQKLIYNRNKLLYIVTSFLFLLVNSYTCFQGYCDSIYGKHIKSTNDSLALECSKDPKCKAFRYSTKYGLGYLCNDFDVRNAYEDWLLCSNPGQLNCI